MVLMTMPIMNKNEILSSYVCRRGKQTCESYKQEKNILVVEYIMLNCLQPVSYTHLDVYKRQITFTFALLKCLF